jgi:hypothetical protein
MLTKEIRQALLKEHIAAENVQKEEYQASERKCSHSLSDGH